jgi:formimidoylglutamate deiminase
MIAETGWLPDFLYRNGRFETGVAMFADENGRISRFSSAPQDLQSARRLTGRALLPGMVNAHSHSFQRAIRGRTEHRTTLGRDTFWTWREAMYHAANSLSPEDIRVVARMAFLEMLASGITAVGEFHYLHHAPYGAFYENPNLLGELVMQAAHETGIRVALQRTAYVRAGWQKDPNPGQARFITPRVEDFIAHTEALRATAARLYSSDSAWVTVAPHSVRAVPLEYLREIAGWARAQAMKVHMHVSEQPAEIEACEAEYSARPIELLDRSELLNDGFTGVHAIHITRDEIESLAKAGSRICACPTTERNLGDGIGAADLWTEAGVLTCYGSDSNMQIDLLEDARELEYHLRLKRIERVLLAPDLDREALAASLFAHATQSGAESIGAPGGSLEEGRPADFFAVDLDDLSIAGAGQSALLNNIVFSVARTAVKDVWVAGKPLIADGRHKLQEEIVRQFDDVQQRLWTSQ